MTLYRSFDVWKVKKEKQLVRYRCFEILGLQQFCVQSSDFYNYPPNFDQVRQLENNFFELILECPPDSRDNFYPTIEEAIAEHEADFLEQ